MSVYYFILMLCNHSEGDIRNVSLRKDSYQGKDFNSVTNRFPFFLNYYGEAIGRTTYEPSLVSP